MIRPLQPVRIGTLLLSLSFFGQPVWSQTFASNRQVATGQNVVAEFRKLKDVLQELKNRYRVDILFEGGLLDQVTVPMNNVNYNQSLEHNLDVLLKSTRLYYKKVKNGSYLILEEKPSRKKSGPDVSSVNPESALLSPVVPIASHPVEKEGGTLISLTAPKVVELAVSGKVTDEKSEGLPGVSVVIKGSTRGTTTDAQGIYRLVVPDDNTTLTFSFVGYTAQEVRVGNRTEINVRLESSDNQLNEVVVTGYTTQQKKDIIGAVAVVKASDLAVTPSSNLLNQLQGRASGVTVSTTGDPGGAATVRIRGFSSYGNNNPLYIIDGVPTTDASRLNPQDVESLQVLKDASSAAIYGARAANGVIIVTTKQGKAGRTVVSYDTYVGTQRMPFNRIPSMLNTAETIQYLDRSTATTYVDPLFGQHGSFSIPDFFVVSNTFRGGVSASDPRSNSDLYTIANYNNIYQILQTSQGTDWFRASAKNAPIQSHQLTASGGTDKSTFSLGLNYFDQAGIFNYTGYNRYSVRVNSSFKPTKFFRFGENVQVSYDNRAGEPTVLGENSPWSYAYRSAPYIPVNDIKGGWGGRNYGIR